MRMCMYGTVRWGVCGGTWTWSWTWSVGDSFSGLFSAVLRLTQQNSPVRARSSPPSGCARFCHLRCRPATPHSWACLTVSTRHTRDDMPHRHTSFTARTSLVRARLRARRRVPPCPHCPSSARGRPHMAPDLSTSTISYTRFGAFAATCFARKSAASTEPSAYVERPLTLWRNWNSTLPSAESSE